MFSVKNAIIPMPQYVEDRKSEIRLKSYNVSGCEKELIEKKLLGLGIFSDETGYKIAVKTDKNDKRFKNEGKEEGYIIEVRKDGAEVIGYDEAGAYYGAVSLCALFHTDGNDTFLPECYILDYPYFSTRGHFMECRYGSDFMTLDDWKKGIDYLSEMKINKLTLGVYGCWKRQYDGVFAEYLYTPISKYPTLKTPRDVKYYSVKERKYVYKNQVLPTMFEEDYFGDLIAYGKEKHIEVFPLFNSLGHNTLIPRLFPEISAVDEEGKQHGVGFCTSNPKTYEIMFDIYDEIIDKYLKPNGIKSFEIGLDEIWDVLGADESDLNKWVSSFCKCEKCRDRKFGDLMVDYIIKIAKHMKEKGIENLYVYHDMLMENGMLNEEFAEKLKAEGVYDIVVIDWWDYRTNKEQLFKGNIDENVNPIFRSIGKCFTGYYHWAIPMQCNENITHICDIAKDKGFEGVIAYSSFEYSYDYNYNFYAEHVWNVNAPKDLLMRYAMLKFPEKGATAYEALSMADDLMFGENEEGNNMCLTYTVLSYYPYCYLNRNKEYPQNYPSRAFVKIRDDEEKMLSHFRSQYAKASAAYKFFDEETSSHIGEMWKNNVATHKVLCDQFLTLYSLNKMYNEGMCSPKEVSSELSRLLKESEKLILLTENVRIPANSYVYVRNMSVMHFAIADLKKYVDDEIKAGRKPEIDIFTFERYLSDISWHLR